MNLERNGHYWLVFIGLAFSWFREYWLRFIFDVPSRSRDQAIDLFPWIQGIQTITLLLFRLGRIMPRFTSLSDAVRIGLYNLGISAASAIFVSLSTTASMAFHAPSPFSCSCCYLPLRQAGESCPGYGMNRIILARMGKGPW